MNEIGANLNRIEIVEPLTSTLKEFVRFEPLKTNFIDEISTALAREDANILSMIVAFKVLSMSKKYHKFIFS